jgi:transposase
VKTDQDDARVLVEACQLGTYRSLLRRTATSARNWAVRDALVRTRTRYIVLAKALVWCDSLWVAGSESEQVAERIAALKLPATLAAELTLLFAILVPLNAEIAGADRYIVELTAPDLIGTLLTTAPGIGPITASALVATINDITCFRSAHEFEVCLDVVPGESSLGKKRRVGRITKGRGTPAPGGR